MLKHFSELPAFLFEAPSSTPARIRFRKARMTDLGPLHRACFAERPLAQFGDAFRRSLATQRHGQGVHLVADHDTEPIATGQLSAYGASVEIADLAVAPAFRGQGVGTALINVLVGIADFAGFDSVEICVMQENTRARELYERLGFVHDRTFSLTDKAAVLVLRRPLDEHLRNHPAQGLAHEA